MESVYEDDEELLSTNIDGFLEIVAVMISDFHNNTRCGDIMMNYLDHYLYEIKDYATSAGVSLEFKDYEQCEDFIEWSTLSKLKGTERLDRAKTLLKKILKDLSEDTCECITIQICSNVLLLHCIMGTLDLHYNQIDNICHVLSEKQINLLDKRKEMYRK
jgi:hypothetical protein